MSDPATPYPAPDAAIDRELDDEWEPEFDELPVRPRRRWLTPLNLGLMAVLLVAAGFVGGVLVEKGQTSSSSASGASAFAALARRAGASGTVGEAIIARELATGAPIIYRMRPDGTVGERRELGT